MRNRRLRLVRSGDDGIAMISAILVGVVIACLSASVLAVSTSNLINSGRDRSGVVALATSESGVAEALNYLTTQGVSAINCYPSTCPTGAWTPGNPQSVTVSNGRSYQVSITPIQPYSPPTSKIGTYQIDSYGSAGAGPGKRHVIETVTLTPFQFPIGVFAQSIDAAGTGSVHREMVFTNGCVINRNAMNFPGNDSTLDPYYGLPPAVYSTGVITDKNSTANCDQSHSIHASSPCSTTGSANSGYEAFDRDLYGGSLTSTTCYSKSTAYGSFTSSQMTSSALSSYIDLTKRPAGLTPAEYAALKYKAQQQGNYWTPSTIKNYTMPCAASPCSGGRTAYPNAVVYFDMSGGTTIDTQLKSIAGFEKANCGSRSLIIVVRNADVSLQDVDLTGALFAPEGTLTFNSNTSIEGTIYAKTLQKFNGTADVYLDPCWIANTPGGLMNARVERYHEDDRH